MIEIDEIKQYLAQYPCFNVMYQKYSFTKLYIKKGGEIDDRE